MAVLMNGTDCEAAHLIGRVVPNLLDAECSKLMDYRLEAARGRRAEGHD